MINEFIKEVRIHDPDIIMGWDQRKGSLGYILHRAKVFYDINLRIKLFRVPYTQDLFDT